MTVVLTVLLAIALAAVLGTLLVGVFTMARGGEANRRFSNRLMRTRVALQLVAVTLFVLLILATRS